MSIKLFNIFWVALAAIITLFVFPILADMLLPERKIHTDVNYLQEGYL